MSCESCDVSRHDLRGGDLRLADLDLLRDLIEEAVGA